MKEIPISFNSEMIRAILAGNKTQTRRIVKPPRWAMGGDVECDGTFPPWPVAQDCYGDHHRLTCPYGPPGGVLWVRESFGIEPGRVVCPNLNTPVGGTFDDEVFYRADDPSLPGIKWCPSIHMPRWACRLTLRIESVRVERLQDITEADAMAEGIEGEHAEGRGYVAMIGNGYTSVLRAFAHLWNSINAKPKPIKTDGIITHYVSYPWEQVTETREYRGLPWYVTGNPWVWVVEFKRTEVSQ